MVEQVLTIEIEGMHCDHCVQSIGLALEAIPGVTERHVQLGKAVVRFDPARTGRAAILAAIRKAGPYNIRSFLSA
jgi:copper chaperone